MVSRADSRVKLEVNLKSIAANFAEIKRHVGSQRVMAVLKANAYGLGVAKIATMLRDFGVDAFGVAEMNEAYELSSLGVPVQILGALLPEDIPSAVELNLWTPVDSLEMAIALNVEAKRQKKIVEVTFPIDSGMGRLGLVAEKALEVILEVTKLENLRIRGIYSHFSSAFMKFDSYNDLQLNRFKRLLSSLQKLGVTFEDIHIAASDGLNNIEMSLEEPFNMVRTGINLYGYCDNLFQSSLNLVPTVELKTKLVAVRQLDAGSAIGYGRMHTLLKESRIGTIAAGYADGLPLALSNRGYVLVRGVLCPVIGRISMDYTTIGLDNLPEATVGDVVTCVGVQGDNAITLQDWASLKGTHAYELLCSFGTRVERIYIDGC